MPDKHTPDRIYTTGNGTMGSWNNKTVNGKRQNVPESEYLLATPVRESAQELLEALEWIVSDMPFGEEPTYAIAAIAKAKGETQ